MFFVPQEYSHAIFTRNKLVRPTSHRMSGHNGRFNIDEKPLPWRLNRDAGYRGGLEFNDGGSVLVHGPLDEYRILLREARETPILTTEVVHDAPL